MHARRQRGHHDSQILVIPDNRNIRALLQWRLSPILFFWLNLFYVFCQWCIGFCVLLFKHVCGTREGGGMWWECCSDMAKTWLRDLCNCYGMWWNTPITTRVPSYHNKHPAICRSVRMPPSARAGCWLQPHHHRLSEGIRRRGRGMISRKQQLQTKPH